MPPKVIIISKDIVDFTQLFVLFFLKLFPFFIEFLHFLYVLFFLLSHLLFLLLSWFWTHNVVYSYNSVFWFFFVCTYSCRCCWSCCCWTCGNLVLFVSRHGLNINHWRLSNNIYWLNIHITWLSLSMLGSLSFRLYISLLFLFIDSLDCENVCLIFVLTFIFISIDKSLPISFCSR